MVVSDCPSAISQVPLGPSELTAACLHTCHSPQYLGARKSAPGQRSRRRLHDVLFTDEELLAARARSDASMPGWLAFRQALHADAPPTAIVDQLLQRFAQRVEEHLIDAFDQFPIAFQLDCVEVVGTFVQHGN